MKVIFLDFDGVLNSRSRWKDCHKVDPRSPSALVDPIAMWRLKSLVSATGAKIVISSAWRHLYQLSQLEGFLWKYGIERGTIIGKTPRIGRRGHEIRHWLTKYAAANSNRPITSYVVLDDDSDAMSGGVDHNKVVKTDWETGLLAEHIIKANKILGQKEAVH